MRKSAQYIAFIYCVAVASNCFGDIYDATADFSTTSNPNGVWSFHYSDDEERDGAYELFSATGSLGGGAGEGSVVWHSEPGMSPKRPFAGVNTTGLGVTSWENGELGLHPGVSGNQSGQGLAVLNWTSPFSGTVSVDYSLQLGLDGSVNWYFDKVVGSTVEEQKDGHIEEEGDVHSIALVLAVETGDVLSLVIDSLADPGSDLVRVSQAKITSVPEPGSTGLLVLALSAGFVRRRKS